MIRLIIIIALFDWFLRAIIWTKDYQINRCIYASWERDEVTNPPVENGRHFADDIFKSIIMKEKFYILIRVSLKIVTKV